MLLILLYDTAARVGEITGLTLQDLASCRSPRKPSSTCTSTSMSSTPNITKLPATRSLFYSLHRGRPAELTADTVAAVLNQAAESARAQCRSIPQNIHRRLLRKTKAMDLYKQGIPLPIIMRLLGHENASTTAAFYAFGNPGHDARSDQRHPQSTPRPPSRSPKTNSKPSTACDNRETLSREIRQHPTSAGHLHKPSA
jgi:site-specific recombinase XerD